MKIERSDTIVYPALFKNQSKIRYILEVCNNAKQFLDKFSNGEWQHIGNLVEEIEYPAVFEDETGDHWLFTCSSQGISLNGASTNTGHTTMTHLYNAKIGRAD